MFSIRQRRCSARDLAEISLLPQRRVGQNLSSVPLRDRIATFDGRRQEEELLLDVGSEQKQVHDLDGPGVGNVPRFGDLSKAADLGLIEHGLAVVRKSQQPAHARNWADGGGIGGRRRFGLDETRASLASGHVSSEALVPGSGLSQWNLTEMDELQMATTAESRSET